MKTLELMSRLASVWWEAPRTLLLTRVRLVGAAVLTIGLIAAVLLSLQLFFFETEPEGMAVRESGRRLATEIIDRLELWIEEVDAERATGFPAPGRPLFVIEDVPQIPVP